MYCVFRSRGKSKTLPWDIWNQHQHLSPTNQSIFALAENLMMKLSMAFILSWRDFSQISSVCQRNGILIEKENAVAQ